MRDAMKAEERRKMIVGALSAENAPVSGGALAGQLGVSRQIIVHDIAILKAAGYDILSTHDGYVMKKTPLSERVFKVRHTSEQTEDELRCIVGLGGTVENVFVWHKVYGRMQAQLNIFSERCIQNFMDGIKSGKSTELMHVTSGYHYHTVKAESEEILDLIGAELEKRGYLVPEI